jgi:pimeloyl-ACP methyl ester carboxylesterase
MCGAQGERDAYLLAAMADPPAALAPRARVVRLPDATHWVHWDAPDAVNRELLALMREPVAGAGQQDS